MSAAIFRKDPPPTRDPISKIRAHCARMDRDYIEIGPDFKEIRLETYTNGRAPSVICLNLEDAKLVSRGLAELIEQVEAE